MLDGTLDKFGPTQDAVVTFHARPQVLSATEAWWQVDTATPPNVAEQPWPSCSDVSSSSRCCRQLRPGGELTPLHRQTGLSSRGQATVMYPHLGPCEPRPNESPCQVPLSQPTVTLTLAHYFCVSVSQFKGMNQSTEHLIVQNKQQSLEYIWDEFT